MKIPTSLAITLSLVGIFLFAFPTKAGAHCDTMNGPVVAAGQKALSTGNLNYALIWIQKEDEQKLREVFEKARKQRQTNEAAADREFFEALVKIHREGEGAAFTGLKAAGDLEPSIAVADKAVLTGDVHPVLDIVPEPTRDHIAELFSRLRQLSTYDINDVEAGREYVESYVEFVHVVEAAAQGKELGAHHDLPEAETHAEPTVVKSSMISTPVIIVGLLGLGIAFFVKKFFA